MTEMPSLGNNLVWWISTFKWYKLIALNKAYMTKRDAIFAEQSAWKNVHSMTFTIFAKIKNFWFQQNVLFANPLRGKGGKQEIRPKDSIKFKADESDCEFGIVGNLPLPVGSPILILIFMHLFTFVLVK